MSKQVLALMSCGVIYTLHPLPESYRRAQPGWRFKYQAYRDGQPWRYFISKKDFEREVAADPLDPLKHGPRGPHAEATRQARQWSEFDGEKMLQQFLDAQEKKRHDP